MASGARETAVVGDERKPRDRERDDQVDPLPEADLARAGAGPQAADVVLQEETDRDPDQNRQRCPQAKLLQPLLRYPHRAGEGHGQGQDGEEDDP